MLRKVVPHNPVPLYKDTTLQKRSNTSLSKSPDEVRASEKNIFAQFNNDLADEDSAKSNSFDAPKNTDSLDDTDSLEDSLDDSVDVIDDDDNALILDAEFEILNDDDDDYTTDELFNARVLPANENANLPQVARNNLPNVFSKDNLQLYLSEISAFPMLKPEEELELAQKVRDYNDPDAAFRLVSSHMRLVVKIAMEFQRRWMQNVLDLIQEGNIGLLRAVNKFDPEKGIKFSYYATFWIRAYILKFIMDNWRMVKIGTTQAQRKLFYNLNKEKQKLISQGFDPDLDVLSERLGVSKEQITEMEQRLDSADLSLDMPVGDENNSISRIDYLPALTQGVEEGFAESEINRIIHEKLEKLMPKLSDKEIFILENRLLTDDPITLREIGQKYDVTRERIRQLEARLVAKMKKFLSEEIEDFSEDWI